MSKKNKILLIETEAKPDKIIGQFNEHKHELSSKDSGAHPYAAELDKFQGANVEVVTSNHDVIRGKCLALYKINLNIVLEVGNEIILLSNVRLIRRDTEKVIRRDNADGLAGN